MTDARRCALPALGAGAALSAMLFASRLPVSLDFILPRRAGWALFVLAHETLSRSGPRSFFTAAATLLFLGSLARFVVLFRSGKRDWLALIAALALAKWSFTIWFEMSQKVWFPFGSLNALEPFANLLVCSGIAFAAMASKRRHLAAWAAANALAALLAYSAYGAWRSVYAADAGRRLFVVLTEEEGRPAQAAYDLPLRAEAAAASGVNRLPALRALYESRAKDMDAIGLRTALMLGVKHGDELARSLLLAHLRAAPPTPQALGALGALADETAFRIGAMGASEIAQTYARLGDRAQAELWAKRAETAPRGIPAGLLTLPAGGALKPGRISGKISGAMPLKVGLYLKSDPSAPYLLDAGALAASAEPDAKGRFFFTGLGAGRYYLAFAYEPRAAEIKISGHRGDLILNAKKTSIDAVLTAASR